MCLRGCKQFQKTKRSLTFALAFGGLAAQSGSAFAQYGGGPPHLEGWVAQPRPGTTGRYSGELDWNGLDITLDLVPWPGTAPAPQSHQKNYNYFGASQNVGNLSLWSDALFKVSGTPTFKWQWQPHYKPFTTQEDFSHFPAPALFTVGYVSMDTSGYGTDASIHVTGSVNPGGPEWMDSDMTPNSFDAIGPLSGSAAMLARAILPASSGVPAVAQMSPTLTAHATAAPTAGGTRSTGDGSARLNVNGWGIYPTRAENTLSVWPAATGRFRKQICL